MINIKKYWTIIDGYILRKFLTTFFFAIIIIGVIACVIDYSQKVDDFVENKAPFSAIVFYFFNFAPQITAMLFSLFIFIATIFFTSKMAYKTEIIAILASGVSFKRLLRPYIVGAGMLFLLSLLVNHIIVPIANRNINNFHEKYIWSKKYSSDQNIHIRLSPQLYVYVQNFRFERNEAEKFTAEKIDGILLKEKLMANKAFYREETKDWLLKNITIRTNDGIKETITHKDSMVIKYPLTPKDFDYREEIKAALTTPNLIKYTQQEIERGRENVNSYLIERYKRTSEAFSGIILTIIGAILASRKIRGGSGFHLVIGIIMSVMYILFQRFSHTFSINSGFNPLVAVWIPNFIFAIVAILMYRKHTT